MRESLTSKKKFLKFLTRINKIMKMHGQQCAAEMLLKIIEDLKLENLFEQKIEKNLYCMNCNNIVSMKKDVAYIYNFSEIDISNNFTKKINMNCNYIDDYKCSKCHKKTKLIILNSLENTKDIFAISFNKYMKKDLIDFPEIITLTNQKTKYQLVGIIDHIGNISGGHYWAQIKRNNQYYHVDDTSVKTITNFEKLKNNFILFYEKI